MSVKSSTHTSRTDVECVYSFYYADTVTHNRPLPRPPCTSYGAVVASIQVAEAYSSSPGATSGDGCVAAEARLQSGGAIRSKVVFDGQKGRLRQSNVDLERNPTENITQIGRWYVKHLHLFSSPLTGYRCRVRIYFLCTTLMHMSY